MKHWIAVFAACALVACAMPPQRGSDASANGVAAETPAADAIPSPAPAATCQPDPYCNRDCLRGYSAAYCRYKCGC